MTLTGTNAGVIFLHHLAKSYSGSLRGESKFFGEFGSINIAGNDIKLLFPTTFMNNSGKSVAAVCKFYKIEPESILVAYDEIDFDVGVTRFKHGGGHGGHNGIRDIISALGNQRDFYRLRIGVGHPGDKSMVRELCPWQPLQIGSRCHHVGYRRRYSGNPEGG